MNAHGRSYVFRDYKQEERPTAVLEADTGHMIAIAIATGYSYWNVQVGGALDIMYVQCECEEF